MHCLRNFQKNGKEWKEMFVWYYSLGDSLSKKNKWGIKEVQISSSMVEVVGLLPLHNGDNDSPVPMPYTAWCQAVEMQHLVLVLTLSISILPKPREKYVSHNCLDSYISSYQMGSISFRGRSALEMLPGANVQGLPWWCHGSNLI